MSKEKYIIKVDRTSFVTHDHNGKLSLTTDKHKAKEFESRDKALNVLKAPPKLWKNRILEIVATEIEETHLDSDVPVIKQTSSPSVYNEIDKTAFMDALDTLSIMMSSMQENKTYLVEHLQEVDLEIQDLLHYIEFYKFSASEGYKLAKRLQECRLRRRDIKNQLESLNIINTSQIKGVINGSVKQNLENVQNKTYTPRVLTSLFEGKRLTGC